MSQDFQPGDYLIFQVEAAYGLLRLLAVEKIEDDAIWHLSAYNEVFIDLDAAEKACLAPDSLSVDLPHVALTTRAFEATQTARLFHQPLNETELAPYLKWTKNIQNGVSDRSIRLLLGYR